MNTDTLPISGVLVAAVGVALAGALFGCADTALASVSSARLGALAKETDAKHRAALERVAARRVELHGLYVTGRVLAVSVSVGLLVWWLLAWQASAAVRLGVGAAGLLILTVLMQCATALGRNEGDWVVRTGLKILRPFELVLWPIAAVTQGCARLLVRPHPPSNPRIAETEVELMVDQRERSGLLEHEPADLIRNVLEFTELTARDAMVPRTRVVAIDVGTPIDEVLQLITTTGHSRYPVYRGKIDDVFGLLHAKDLFRVLRTSRRPPDPAGEPDDEGPSQLTEVVRTPVFFVSETQPLSSLLTEMRQKAEHLGVVLNEFGGVGGIVTLEDVLEEIVGDIRDESDTEEAPITDLGDGKLVADAAVLLSELGAFLGTELDPDGEFDSLGGMLTQKLGRVPAVGTTLQELGITFIVKESDEKHVAKVEVVPPFRPSISPAARPSESPASPNTAGAPPSGTDGE